MYYLFKKLKTEECEKQAHLFVIFLCKLSMNPYSRPWKQCIQPVRPESWGIATSVPGTLSMSMFHAAMQTTYAYLMLIQCEIKIWDLSRITLNLTLLL